MTYKVHVGGRRYRWFVSQDSARAFCAEVFRRTGIVLAIVEGGR